MRNLSHYFDYMITLIITLTLFLFPWFYLDLTTDHITTPKIYLLLISCLLLLILKPLHWLSIRRINLTHTPLDFALILVLLILYLSFLFSPVKTTSFTNFIHWGIYILFYFILAFHIREISKLKVVLLGLLVGTTFASIILLLSYFKVTPPLYLGSLFEGIKLETRYLIQTLLITTPLFIYFIYLKPKYLTTTFSILLLTLIFSTILLLGTIPQIICFLVILIITIAILSNFYNPRRSVFRQYKSLILEGLPALIISLVIFTASFFPNDSNPFYRSKSILEGSSSFLTSWQITKESLTKNSLLGTGPGSYEISSKLFRPNPSEENNPYSFNLWLEILSTLGPIGSLVFILLFFQIGRYTLSGLSESSEPLIPFLSASTLSGLSLTLVEPINPILILLLLVMISLQLCLRPKQNRYLYSTHTKTIIGTAIYLFILGLVGLFLETRVILADYYHQQGLRATNKDSLEALRLITKATELNPYLDYYQANLSLSQFSEARSILDVKKEPQNLNERDQKRLTELIEGSLSSAKKATEINPYSVDNQLILANLYLRLSRVNPDYRALADTNFQRAIALDPKNPQLYLTIGEIYYSFEDYPASSRYFRLATQVKQDYANGLYNLSLSLQREGKLDESKEAILKTIALLNEDSSDYKAATYFKDQLEGPKESSPSSSLNLPSSEVSTPVIPTKQNTRRRLI